MTESKNLMITMAKKPAKRPKKAVLKCPHCKKTGFNTEKGFKQHVSRFCKLAKGPTPPSEEETRVGMADNLNKILDPNTDQNFTEMKDEVLNIVQGRPSIGRPTVMTDLTLQKLRFAFILGCTDSEACFLSGICDATLYNYQNEHPEFLEEKEALKNYKKIRARITILRYINHPEMAKWYLELKANTEFSRRTISTGEVLNGTMTPERAKRATEIMEAFDPNIPIRINNDQQKSIA